jgi:hypothetical protein
MSQELALWLSGFETRIDEEVQKASKAYRHPCVKSLSRVAVNTQLVNSESALPCYGLQIEKIITRAKSNTSS